MPEITLPPLSSNTDPAYFADPLLDRFAAALIETLARVWVLQDRVHTLERVLEANGLVSPEQLDQYQPNDQEITALRQERDLLIRTVLERIAKG